ncbi:MAG: sulfate adenylyltransferase, partial [Planctomycetes bacterium]|nr:sulfate adenylyltransferase [Planctomycetota bacterium]
MKNLLITPHGGQLVNLLVSAERAKKLKVESKDWKSWDLTPRQICDLELLMSGGFSPLTGFMGKKDYESVCSSMRLQDGTLWPIPIILDVSEGFAEKVKLREKIALRNPEGVMLAAIVVDDLWKPEKEEEANSVYGTVNTEHPGVQHLFSDTHPWYLSGQVEGIELPEHFDFRTLRKTPEELRSEFLRSGWKKIVAFQTRNPMHRAHFELTMRAIKEHEASLLIHPVVGLTKPGDVDHYTRVRCYQALLDHYPANTARLALLSLAMRMAGPREAVLHAIIRKNHGCTHFIVGRDHAGPGNDATGTPFYDPYEAQQLLKKHESELGVQLIPFKTMVYLENKDMYIPT